jgi:hypothetical protein
MGHKIPSGFIVVCLFKRRTKIRKDVAEMKAILKTCLKWGACYLIANISTSAVVIVPSDSEVTIPIDTKTGSLLQLPSSVKTITPSKNFEIVDVASDIDAATGTKVDVRLFQVRPLPGARSENVTFVLGNGRTVKTQFLPSETAEKHYDLVFPTDTKKIKDTKFLQSEIALMKAMIRDEGGDFARQVKDSSVSISGLDDVGVKLVRFFAGNGLTGYTLSLSNKSSMPLTVDVSQMTLKPSRESSNSPATENAILLHAEKENLEPCGIISSTECKTRVFVVSRGESFGGFGLHQKPLQEGASKAPFMKANPSENESQIGGVAP